MRAVALALAVLASPAAAADRAWPTAADRWRLDVQAPAGPGRTRYSTVEAAPGGNGGWDVVVTCGVHESSTGRILSRFTARGRGQLARGPGMGGTYDGQVDGSYIVDLPPGDALDVRAQFTNRRCASGIGQLSSGD